MILLPLKFHQQCTLGELIIGSIQASLIYIWHWLFCLYGLLSESPKMDLNANNTSIVSRSLSSFSTKKAEIAHYMSTKFNMQKGRKQTLEEAK